MVLADINSLLHDASSQYLCIPLKTRVTSVIRSIMVFFVKECPLFWTYALQGSRNSRADMEGPYYMLGAPDCHIESGKAILGTAEDLQKFKPYLMILEIKTPKGDPVPYASFDWWQADTAGVYSNTTYRFRGKFTANAEGVAEVVTVAPGEYGPQAYRRAGHFHVIISPGEANPELEALTTQLYVCPKNDSRRMDEDFLNYVRAARPQNMNNSWCISAGEAQQYMGFPELDSSDADTLETVQWWNQKLADEGLNIVAGARTEIYLNMKGWLPL